MSRRAVSVLSLALVLTLAVVSSGCTSIRTRVWMNAGNKLYKAQKYEQAIGEYQKIVAADPANWPASYQIAMSYLALYHPGSTHSKDLEFADKSAAGFERLLKMQAPNPETAEKVRNYYIALLRSADKTDKAIAYYEELLGKEPRNTSYMAQLAEIYAKKGDIANALKYYEKRAEVEPTAKEAWYTIGVVCWEQVKKLGPTLSDEERSATIERGLKAMEKALALDANYFDALVYTGLLYREKSQALSAQQKAEEAGEAYTMAEEFRHRAEEIGKKRMAEAAAKKAG